MKPDRQASRIIWGAVLLVVVGIAAVSVASAIRQGRSAATLQDPNPAVRVAALRATGYAGHVDLLIRGLQDEDADVRLVAAMQLKWRKAAAAPAIDSLIAALRDKHAGVRREAAEALSTIGAPAAPALVAALTDSDPRVRAKAASALKAIAFSNGRSPSPDLLAEVASALEKVLSDEDAEVRKNAAEALGYIRRAAAGEKLYEK